MKVKKDEMKRRLSFDGSYKIIDSYVTIINTFILYFVLRSIRCYINDNKRVISASEIRNHRC